MKKLNLLGKRFGRLVVISENGRSSSGDVIWRCKCDCGKYKDVTASSLKVGDTISCGCYFTEKLIERNRRYNRYDMSGDYGVCYFEDN